MRQQLCFQGDGSGGIYFLAGSGGDILFNANGGYYNSEQLRLSTDGNIYFMHDVTAGNAAIDPSGNATFVSYSVSGTTAIDSAGVPYLPSFPTGSEPSPVNGQPAVIFDSTLQKMKFWNGSAWSVVTSTP